ncbi:MAG: helix-turn-helix domain-containing protein [Acidobacteriaceae bacterium]
MNETREVSTFLSFGDQFVMHRRAGDYLFPCDVTERLPKQRGKTLLPLVTLAHHTATSSRTRQRENTLKADERSIYPNLKLTIYKSGMRQNRLAKLVGIHEAYLSRIINGTREPGEAVRNAIAAALHSEVEWLFEREKMVAFPDAEDKSRRAS